jgi:Ca2+/Na+ antiporter
LSVTGLSSDKESAQEYASTGVGLLAGSSILLMTLVWGTCVIVSKQSLKNISNSSQGSIKQYLTGLIFILYIYVFKLINDFS